MGDVGAPELIIILVVVLLLFGGAKLPELARSLGKAKNEFQKGVDEGMPGAAEDPQAVTPAPDHEVAAPPAIGAPPISTTADEVHDVAASPPASPAPGEREPLS